MGGRRATPRCRGSKATLTPDRLLDVALTAVHAAAPGLAAPAAGAHGTRQRCQAAAFSIPAPQPPAGSGLTLTAAAPLSHFRASAAAVSTGVGNSMGSDRRQPM